VSTPTSRLPDELALRYVNGRVIGSGAMASVFVAEDRELARPVAIKVFRHTRDPVLLERFRREGQLLARVRHASVVQVLDCGEAGSEPYIVCEYVDAGSLRDRLRAAGRFEPLAAVDVVQQVLEGLAACHAEGVIHRDLKPDNILLTSGGQVKIADLGIAHLINASPVLTEPGVMVGTPMYMAPEQTVGDTVTPAADLYSIGVLLFELITGSPPFSAVWGRLRRIFVTALPSLAQIHWRRESTGPIGIVSATGQSASSSSIDAAIAGTSVSTNNRPSGSSARCARATNSGVNSR
jgi:serine/threonine-protein kinase